MWYNYARFGSLFDFGANYNLTTNDMTKRGFNASRIGPALFACLFAPSPISATFPYVGSILVWTNSLGQTITELCYGGVITTTPFLWIFTCLPLMRRRLSKLRLWSIVGWCLFCAAALAALDAEMAGILYRYLMDYTMPLLFAGVLCWLAGEQALGDHCGEALVPRVQNVFRVSMNLTAASNLVFAFLLFFAAEPYLYKNTPGLFNSVSRLVQFWL